MAAMTPIRVRGKRTGTTAEKRQNTKIQQKRVYSWYESRHDSGGSSDDLHKYLAKPSQNTSKQSGLESLPTEMIQIIFELSGNVDLPLASPTLARQLGSHHLFHQLTHRILGQVLNSRSLRVTSLERAAATRLLNCKFCTWDFFQEWIRGEFDRLHLIDVWEERGDINVTAGMDQRERDLRTWHELQPDPELLPPVKLISGPFSGDNIKFLKLLLSARQKDASLLDPVYQEIAQEGLQQAVRDGSCDALVLLWKLGLQPDMELLRKAVLESPFNLNVVRGLLTRLKSHSSTTTDVDFLDPALWAWAHRAKLAGDQNGTWLCAVLQDFARNPGCKAVEIDNANGMLMS